ncbi:MAG: hypothetical protein BEN19_00275 [Epulopiscium sp. Nuni2H_MBin003]|nr:MAG: hypothetical protein BEN19_00275 [Epulopiscium sp. Nuni2H_MBin003]
MTPIIFLLLLIIYNYTIFSYTYYIIGSPIKLWKIVVITSIINLILLSSHHFIPNTNITSAIIYIFSYAIQFMYIHKIKFKPSFFMSSIFIVYLYASGLITSGLLQILLIHNNLYDTYQFVYLDLIISILTIFPSILQLWLIRFYTAKEKTQIMLSNEAIVTLSTKLLLTTFIYALIVIELNTVAYRGALGVAIFLFKIGLVIFAIIYITLIYGSIFASLELKRIKFEEYVELVDQETQAVKELTQQSQKDDFTGLYLRTYAVTQLQSYRTQNIECYAVFLDMNSLKIVNDTYGHNEGDFYILSVAKIIEQEFLDDTVARIGGDEFLVIGQSNNTSIAVQKTLAVYENVKALKQLYNKPYDTSISYGIVNIDETYNMSACDIVTLADERMYAFKTTCHKQRQVIKI